MTAPVLRPLTVGEILDHAFGIYRRQFGPLAVIGIVCLALPLVVNVFLQFSGGLGSLFTGERGASGPILAVVYLLVAVALNMLAIAATTEVISAGYLGRVMRSGDALRRAAARVPALLALSIATTLAVAAGALLAGGVVLVALRPVSVRGAFAGAAVAGVVAAAFLSLSLLLGPAVLVIERPAHASAAMGRSWSLTRGYRLRLLALGVVILVLLLIVLAGAGTVVSLIATALGSGGAVGTHATAAIGIAAVIMAVFRILLFPLFYALLTVTYYDLRVRKEAFDLEMLAAALEQPAT